MSEETPEAALPDGDELFEHHRIVADKGQSLLRVDKFLFNLLPNTSRNRLQMAAKSGYVRVNGKAVKSNYKVRPHDIVTLELPQPVREFELIAEYISKFFPVGINRLRRPGGIGESSGSNQTNGIRRYWAGHSDAPVQAISSMAV